MPEPARYACPVCFDSRTRRTMLQILMHLKNVHRWSTTERRVWQRTFEQATKETP